MKLTIVGGGTSGWLSALFLKKHFAQAHITVLASSEIGILGAGEGTTGNFIPFMRKLDISIGDLIKNAKATFKNGIVFQNWNGQGTQDLFFHGFKERSDLMIEAQEKSQHSDVPLVYLQKIAQGDFLNDYSLAAHLSHQNQVMYISHDFAALRLNAAEVSRHVPEDSLLFEIIGSDALHFDARLLASYLQKVACSRGVEYIDDELIEVKCAENGDIRCLETKQGLNLETDFVFDCSGFRRLIIGKHYQSTWISYKNTLPVNRALPFFIPHDNKAIEPYTQAIAMRYGWMWKIPVQGRYGCGYVFDANQISDADAMQEIEQFLGHSVESPTVFNFEAGVYENPWINNAVSIGLSSGFLEPLEATSIMVQIGALNLFLKHQAGLMKRDVEAVSAFNLRMREINSNVLELIHLHYLTKRRDTPFWSEFAKTHKRPPLVAELEELSKRQIPPVSFFTQMSQNLGSSVFPLSSWYAVATGNHFFNPQLAHQMLDQNESADRINTLAHNLKARLKDYASRAMSHGDMIEVLLKNPNSRVRLVNQSLS